MKVRGKDNWKGGSRQKVVMTGKRVWKNEVLENEEFEREIGREIGKRNELMG